MCASVRVADVKTAVVSCIYDLAQGSVSYAEAAIA